MFESPIFLIPRCKISCSKLSNKKFVPQAVAQRYSTILQKSLLKNFAKFRQNTYARVFFLSKIHIHIYMYVSRYIYIYIHTRVYIFIIYRTFSQWPEIQIN